MYSRHKGQEKFLLTQSFATGAAFMNMALEGTARNYLVHSMAGYNRDKTAVLLGIEKNPHFNIEVFVAIGKRVPPSERGRKEKKDKMNLRNKMSDLVNSEVFKKEWIY